MATSSTTDVTRSIEYQYDLSETGASINGSVDYGGTSGISFTLNLPENCEPSGKTSEPDKCDCTKDREYYTWNDISTNGNCEGGSVSVRATGTKKTTYFNNPDDPSCKDRVDTETVSTSLTVSYNGNKTDHNVTVTSIVYIGSSPVKVSVTVPPCGDDDCDCNDITFGEGSGGGGERQTAWKSANPPRYVCENNTSYEIKEEYETYDGWITSRKTGNTTKVPSSVNACTPDTPVIPDIPIGDLKQYFTIESREDGNIIKFNSIVLQRAISVSTDGKNWVTYSASSNGGTTIATLKKGQKLFLKGNNESYYYRGNYTYFSSTKKFDVSGNIMSLITGTSFENAKVLTKEYTFARLFFNCVNLISAEGLLLPATTLSYGCYYEMFRACSGLVNPPVLPATTLSDSCYNFMFGGCHALETAPNLPATTLSKGCYANMFYECNNLKNPPKLPATELKEICYFQMFYGCDNLATAPILPATSLVARCYESMFNDCRSLNSIDARFINEPSAEYMRNWVSRVSSEGTFYVNSSIQWDPQDSRYRGINGIPVSWNVIGREQPAPTPVPDDEYESQYLTVEAIDDKTPIMIQAYYVDQSDETSVPRRHIFWSSDNGSTWNDYYTEESGNHTIFTLQKAGDKILFKGNNTSYYGNMITASGGGKRFKVYGNIMSLLYGDNFEGQDTLPSNDTFKYLFSRTGALISAKNLVLPATAVTENAYYGMFLSCPNLEDAPELPATELGRFCYYYMFANCSSLTSAPELPATELVSSCYGAMFSGCTNLVSAPELYARDLKAYCYFHMFEKCSKLDYIKMLGNPNVPGTNGCTSSWVNGVNSVGVFVKSSVVTMGRGTSGIPNGWSVNDE